MSEANSPRNAGAEVKDLLRNEKKGEQYLESNSILECKFKDKNYNNKYLSFEDNIEYR